MPLPDATKDKRIYQLLKNIDLGNLTFEEFQTAAQSVFAEPEAEDTLRRIVLVNLARMSVAGDWEGLTSAGGGGEYTPVLSSAGSISTAYDMDIPVALPPWGNNSLAVYYAKESPAFYPFIAPTSGTVASMQITIDTAATGTNTLEVGIYDDVDGVPSTRQTQAVFDGEVVGTTRQTSLSGTAVLVKGTQYWIGHCETGTPGFKVYTLDTATPTGSPVNSTSGAFTCLQLAGGTSDLSLPATVTASTIAQATLKLKFLVGLTYS